MDNKTIYNFEFQQLNVSNVVYKGDDRAYIYGYNSYSSMSKLKNVRVKETLKLPTNSMIRI